MKNILFFFLILLDNILCAQLKPKEYYPVYINYPDYTVKTTIASQSKKINTRRDLTYYWYSSNKIQETTGGADGKILHGLYSAFYLNGNLKEKGYFKSGVKNGEWISWYENGKIKDIIVWRKGIMSKSAFHYNAEGELVSSSKYRNGKLNGYQVQYRSGTAYEKKKYKKGVEVIAKIKKEKQKKNEDSGTKSGFSDKYKAFKANIEKRISGLKSRKTKNNEPGKNKEPKQKEKEEKSTFPEKPKKTTKDKNALTLKKKENPDKKNQNEASAK